ncbi:DUF6069 family protein [Marinitenerispora sediminis]|uniref:Uncharacterized protein n=1 Tax=Marinitenerispora sediminis TaxID=1931232 RepID=A0A368T3A9_9ACTN|nr:DUF6069 family protein [Marinitenerispora sediminis]RCV49368.1 hypothetical protein DEF28_21010 [Marinitenerispora sediminis]RCV55987.1 hypothetical protein DEF23_13375 [Marinitenerispora sediminis]RCV56602.1 hypothetical protein DEF24_16390 [Marinitenerispora sediminis]
MRSEPQLIRSAPRPALLATLAIDWRSRLIGGLSAVLACVLIWLAGGAMGASFVVSFGAEDASMEVTLGAVIGSVLAAATAGWVLLIALELLTTRARTIWTAVALTVAAASLLPAFSYEADIETTLSLTFMHIAAAAVIVPFFRRRGDTTAGKTHKER